MFESVEPTGLGAPADGGLGAGDARSVAKRCERSRRSECAALGVDELPRRPRSSVWYCTRALSFCDGELELPLLPGFRGGPPEETGRFGVFAKNTWLPPGSCDGVAGPNRPLRVNGEMDAKSIGEFVAPGASESSAILKNADENENKPKIIDRIATANT